jgi:hypothetical protein
MVGKIILNYLIITTIIYIVLFIWYTYSLFKSIAKNTTANIKTSKNFVQEVISQDYFTSKRVKWILGVNKLMRILCPIQKFIHFKIINPIVHPESKKDKIESQKAFNAKVENVISREELKTENLLFMNMSADEIM